MLTFLLSYLLTLLIHSVRRAYFLTFLRTYTIDTFCQACFPDRVLIEEYKKKLEAEAGVHRDTEKEETEMKKAGTKDELLDA